MNLVSEAIAISSSDEDDSGGVEKTHQSEGPSTSEETLSSKEYVFKNNWCIAKYLVCVISRLNFNYI